MVALAPFVFGRLIAPGAVIKPKPIEKLVARNRFCPAAVFQRYGKLRLERFKIVFVIPGVMKIAANLFYHLLCGSNRKAFNGVFGNCYRAIKLAINAAVAVINRDLKNVLANAPFVFGPLIAGAVVGVPVGSKLLEGNSFHLVVYVNHKNRLKIGKIVLVKLVNFIIAAGGFFYHRPGRRNLRNAKVYPAILLPLGR